MSDIRSIKSSEELNRMVIAAAFVHEFVVLKYSSSGGSTWAPTEKMYPGIWDDKKRRGKQATANLLFSIAPRFYGEAGLQNQLTVEDIVTALDQMVEAYERKKAAEPAAKAEIRDQSVNEGYETLDQEVNACWGLWEKHLKSIGYWNRYGIYDSLGEISTYETSFGKISYEAYIVDRLVRLTAKLNVKSIDKALVKERVEQLKRAMWYQAKAELYEAVRYDGKSTFHEFKRIFLPLYATLHEDLDKVNPDEVELDCATIYHFIWQVKRKMLGLSVENHLVPIIYGAQNIGKEYFISSILHPLHGFVFLYNDMDEVVDAEKHGKAISENFVGYMAEMSGADRTDVNKVKAKITAKYTTQRGYHTQDHRTIINRMTFISSANKPFKTYWNDTTGTRRFKEIRATLRRLTDEIRYFRGKLLEECRMSEDSWAARFSYDLWQSVDETAESIFHSSFYLLSVLEAHQSEITPDSFIAKYLKITGAKSGYAKKIAYEPFSVSPTTEGAVFIPLTSLYQEYNDYINRPNAKDKFPNYAFDTFEANLRCMKELRIAKSNGKQGLWLLPVDGNETDGVQYRSEDERRDLLTQIKMDRTAEILGDDLDW